MISTPMISIVIPVYKVEKYLRRALDSVLAQTYGNFEAICVNDGSPDNCGAILEEYAAKDERIKIIAQSNQGLSQARNNALKKINGNYVCFLDSDDAFHPQALEICLDLMKKENADIVSFQYEKSDGQSYHPDKIDAAKLKYRLQKEPLKFIKTKKYKFEMNVWSKLYKREIIKSFDFISSIHFEDLPWLCAILSKRPKTIVLDIPLIYYTINQSSISRQGGSVQQIRDYETGVKYVYDVYQNHQDKGLIKHYFLPIVLKHQLNRCKRATPEVQKEMYRAFAEELRWLKEKDLLSWRGHKLKRYLAYRKLIKKGIL